jgi:hypothetical protein
MWGRTIFFALLVFVVPAVGRAQETPEQLLPDGAQVYFRWDGIDAHRADYEKTALGKMMQGDTGTFVNGAFGQLQESLGALLTVQQLLEGVPPKALKQLQDDAADAPKLLGELGKHGFLLTVEVRGLEPPQVQATLVIPDAGEKPGPLFSALRLGTGLAKLEVTEAKIAGRTVWHVTAGPVRIAWWIEGKHAMVSAGTEGPEAVLKRMQDKETAKLAGNPLFKKVTGFKEFATGLRGYVDVAALVKMAKTRDKKVAQLLDDLGLDGLRSLTFYSGFDGAAERSLTEWDMPGPRKGLLRLAGGKSFKLADVPPIAPDALSWSMMNFDLAILYDEALKATEGIVDIVAPDELPKIKGAIDMVDQALGVNLRQDLLGSLGGQFATYSSPSEGPLSLGQTFMFKVKDAKKLQETLDQIVKGIGKATGQDISVTKKKYRGVELNMVEFRKEGFIFVPTYAIHKDWLIVSYFPQQVEGYILRATGELPAWKPEPSTVAALDKLPKEFVSISVSDPRPGVKQLLALAPLAGGAINSFVKESKFDVSTIPNAQEATRHLFPNVSVVSDDGKTLRMETRASIVMPLDLTGIDTYALFFLASFAFRAF